MFGNSGVAIRQRSRTKWPWSGGIARGKTGICLNFAQTNPCDHGIFAKSLYELPFWRDRRPSARLECADGRPVLHNLQEISGENTSETGNRTCVLCGAVYVVAVR
ncbi:MAG TPA: hypothetical protein VMV19_10925 [Xanthobacteraceae bacterium]|nr:hypothetical protein [Xanthobacteraceae bacterium]